MGQFCQNFSATLNVELDLQLWKDIAKSRTYDYGCTEPHTSTSNKDLPIMKHKCE